GLVLALAACGPTNDEEMGDSQRERVPADLRARWEADLARFEGGPDFALLAPAPAFRVLGRYLFGKFRYRLDFYERGDEIALASWGTDYTDTKNGSAWFAVGSGRREGDEARVQWSCVNLTYSYSNAGGARVVFEEDRQRVRIEYYHNTRPEHVQWGTGVLLDERGERALSESLVANEEMEHFLVRDRVTVRGSVTSEGTPVVGAAIFLRAESRMLAVTGPEGTFDFSIDRPPNPMLLACAAPGYHNSATWVDPEAPVALFRLRRLPERDHPEYRFVSPVPDARELIRCGNCHDVHHDQWKDSAHAWSGKSSLYATWASLSCRPCHETGAHFEGAAPDVARGPRLAGIGCDPCHKIASIRMDLPPADRLLLLRPDPEDRTRPGPVKLVFGPLPDSYYAFMGAAWNRLYERSEYCAACHEHANASGVPVDTTWSEWKEYARGREGVKTCQDCHMPPTMDPRQIARYQLPRNATEFHDHSFPMTPEGENADGLPLAMSATRQGKLQLAIEVSVENDGGHAAPAGKAGRTLYLVIVAVDRKGRELAIASGPVLGPEAGIPSTPELSPEDRYCEGAFAGLPGLAFARRLDVPPGDGAPFERATGVLEDTRIAAGESRSLRVVLSLERTEGPYHVRSALVSRLARGRPGEKADRPLERFLAEKTTTIP
ncbi:MAG: hypothetical protein HY720_25295, partial [Planctomycetes bacterium]|nr:hypothetical protein [Planctomycetota bacterium]